MSERAENSPRVLADAKKERRDSALFGALAEDLARRGLAFRFRASGQSMRPAIGDGDAIEVRPAAQSGLQRGDILLTQGDDGFKAHRLVALESERSGFVTRGDASERADTRGGGRILGKVVSVERNGRRIELAGRARVLLQAASRLAFCIRAAMRARAKQPGNSGAALVLLVLAGWLAAPVARAASDLSVTETVSPSVVAAGATITYTITFKNTGTTNAATAALFMRTPPNTTFNSDIPQGGWACANPGAGNAGAITCTRATFAAGATATFIIVVNVNAGVAAGTQILQNVNGTSNTADTNGQNNSASSVVLVEPLADADMSLTMVANPATVFVSSTYTYNITVTDLGQANATGVTVTDNLPANVTFVSATPSQGTGCTVTGGTMVSCPLGTVNASASATVAIQVTAPSSSAMISNTASVSTTATDPVASNNSATVLAVVQPIVCAKPANDGTPGAALANVVNTYYPPSGAQVVSAGQAVTSITVGTASGSATPPPIAVGDLLLIMQMQDAAIDSNNAGDYGDGSAGDPGSGYTALNSAGLYEFVVATSAAPITGPNTLTVTGTGANGGLLNTYTAAAATGTMGQRTFQVIRVPQYQAATLGAGLAALPWNGTVGGILVLDVAGQLTLNSTTISADAIGFRGGAGIQLQGPGTAGSANTDYRTLSSNPINASKGEGIAGTPKFIANAAITNLINTGVEGYPNGSYARGAPGNAGGGGTDGDTAGNSENSGGGGGGNGGAGGVGGYSWNLPGVGQGFGGVLYPASIGGIVMGGGGGAGTTNNGTSDPTNANPAGINSSGAAGGGILIFRSGSIVGTGTLTANGQTSLNVMNDGGGGGGAGGSIVVLAVSGGVGTLTANANGGSGGNTWRTQAPGGYPGQRHGPGGGGGGGAIFLSGAATTSVLGGASGVTDTDGDSFGSLPGSAGIVSAGIAPSQTPGVRSGAECAIADLQVTDSGTPNPVAAGSNITYTQTIMNNGPQDAVNAVFTEQVPANTTFVSLSAVAGWNCVTPAVGSAGTITCTNPNFTNGSSATFTYVTKVTAGTTNGTIVTDVTSVSSGTNDSNLANNTATVQTTVSAATAADLALTKTGSPNPVLAGGQITYLLNVVNNGPAASAFSALTESSLPANTTFQSMTPPAGWNCTTPAVGGTGNLNCTIAGLVAGYSGTFTLVLNVLGSTASGTTITNSAHVGSTTPDALPGNNDSSASVVVATAGQADVSITGTVSPNPVLAGNNITYNLTVTNNGPSPTSAAAVMVTDTLPAGVTFVSATPSVGSCSVTAGVLTCSLGALASGASANIAVVYMVNSSTAAATKITSTFTASSTTADPNPANNSVALSTFVAVPNDADVSVTKIGSPNPVNVNTTLVYTIQVRNNGPAVATTVVATDTLPSAVTYVSSSVSQGSCVQAGSTVTCTIGKMTVGQVVLMTINVTASTFSSATLATNTVTITHTDPDAAPANNTATFVSTIQASTAVQLAGFQAARQPGGGVMVEWRTREESHNLGFHLYRLQGGTKTRLNPSLIAGAALTFRGGLPQHGAKTYRWLDSSAGSGEAEYELESVEMDGTRSTHGPAALEGDAPPAMPESAAPPRSLTLSEMNRAAAATPPAPGRLSQALPAAVRPYTPATISNDSLASRPAIKISIQHEGWYRVTQPQLIAAGLQHGLDVRALRLFAEGVDQPFLIDGHPAGPFGPSDAIEFYGTGIDTPFSDTRVYWLVAGDGTGEHITAAPASRGGGAAPASFPFSVVREDRTTYFAALHNGEDNDNFFGALVGSTPVEQDLTVAHSDPGFSGGSLVVVLQGAVDAQEHRVSVALNGNYLGEMDFFGLGNSTQSFPLAAGEVPNGTNAVVLTALAGDNDFSLVQSITLNYGHTYAADANWLRLTALAGETVQITGFTNPRISVYDITNPLQIIQVHGFVTNLSGSYRVGFITPGIAGHTSTLVAFSADQIESPAALAHHAPVAWGHAQNSADVVIISHPDFTASLAPLVSLRRDQGHTVALVPVDDLYDEFNFGERSPYALRSFLSAAQANWSTKPQSVLLVGDASFDPRNYLGLGDFDFVPTRLIQTMTLKTASDDWFSDFAGNGFATIPTGRVPARTATDASNVVNKIVGYETGASPGAWTSQVLLIGDQNGGFDFTGATNAVELLLPSTLGVTKILADGQDPAAVHQQVIAALNSGQAFVNFLGHGSVEQWSLTGFFDNADATSLANGRNLPFVVSMDCLSGFFQDVFTTSLAETLLLSPDGGAVAVWASSGFTTADPQATMDYALVNQLTANPGITLGRAILNAKAGTVDSDVRRTWILFGDPAMRLRLPAPAPATSATKR